MQILDGLLSEHEHVRRMLSVFDDELGGFEQAENADYDILGGCITYCRDYLDQWHHPREDSILEVVSRRDSEAGRSLQPLTGQHQDLAKSTIDLARMFDDVAKRGGVYLREELVELGRSLSSAYREHLDWEEVNFFPLAERLLTEEDWGEIAGRDKGPADPMSTTPVDKRYRMLFSAISERQDA